MSAFHGYDQGFEGDDYAVGSRSMLGQPLALHNIENVERFCSAIVSKHCNRSGARLSYHQRRDLIDFLMVHLYGMAAKFDHGLNDDFDGFAQRFLPLRVADWYREWHGDSRWANSSVNDLSLDVLTRSTDQNDDEGEKPIRALRGEDWTAESHDKLEGAALVGTLGELSEESRWIIENVIRPKSEGASRDQLAADLGVSKNKIDRYIAQVRKELEERLTLDQVEFIDDDSLAAFA